MLAEKAGKGRGKMEFMWWWQWWWWWGWRGGADLRQPSEMHLKTSAGFAQRSVGGIEFQSLMAVGKKERLWVSVLE